MHQLFGRIIRLLFGNDVINSIGKNHDYYCLLLLLYTYVVCFVFVLGLVFKV